MSSASRPSNGRVIAVATKKLRMTLEDTQVKRLTLDLLKSPSERDQQRKVGASQISNPCDYCLGRALKGGPSEPNKWWLGARIGTAIHNALEAEEKKHIDSIVFSEYFKTQIVIDYSHVPELQVNEKERTDKNAAVVNYCIAAVAAGFMTIEQAKQEISNNSDIKL